jgi:hypothetical protein
VGDDSFDLDISVEDFTEDDVSEFLCNKCAKEVDEATNNCEEHCETWASIALAIGVRI